MTYTVARLHESLGELIARGHGRKPVLVHKTSFRHALEDDGAVMLGIQRIVGLRWIVMTDDDGGTKFNKDGTEAGKMVVVLSGDDEGTQ